MTSQLAITDGLDRGAVVRLDKPGSVFHGYTAIVLGRGDPTAGRDRSAAPDIVRVQAIYPLLYADPTPWEPFAPMYLSGPIWFEVDNVVRIEAS